MIVPTITARARALLAAWRAQLHRSYVVHGVTPVTYGDPDIARDIAELDEVIAELAAPQAEPVRVYLVATGETHEHRETYTRHDTRPPLCDAETLFASAPSAVATEPPGWREALKFYAEGNHFAIVDDMAWDTVSGEPENFLCDSAGTATVEDGTVAKMALAGTPLLDEADAAPAQGGQPGDAL